MRLEFTRVQFNYPSQVFLKKEYPIRLKESGVFFLAERKHENNHQEIDSHLNPLSFFIFSTMSSFKASAKAWLIGNPFLAKLMAGWTRSSQLNLPCSFHAWCWPRTSPGTAIARPPGKKRCEFNTNLRASLHLCDEGSEPWWHGRQQKSLRPNLPAARFARGLSAPAVSYFSFFLSTVDRRTCEERERKLLSFIINLHNFSFSLAAPGSKRKTTARGLA